MTSGRDLVIPSRKGQVLVSILALRAGEPLIREKLVGLLWGDRSDAQARASLRQELTTLRKIFSGFEPAPLHVEGERLWLDGQCVDVDVAQFERLMRSSNLVDLERGIELYRGPFLGELTVRDSTCAEWLFQERERLRGLVIAGLDRVLARRIEDGALDRAIQLAETILTHDPLREDTHRQLMELYARQGRRAHALKQYQVCRMTLARELNVEPEPATTKLYEEIRDRRKVRGERSDQVPASGPVTLPPAGSNRGREESNGNKKPRLVDPSAIEEAAQLYQMGRSFFLRNTWGRRALEAAQQLFRQAIEAYPGYARAYAGLAYCDCYRLLLGDKDVTQKDIAANCQRALELGPELPDSLTAKGLSLYVAGDHEGAAPHFERAIALGPELYEAHYFLARNCWTLGQHERAARHFEKAASLNKNDFRALGLLADAYRSIGKLGESLAASKACLERVRVEVAAHPDDWHALSFGATILAEVGHWEQAVEWIERARKANPDDPIVNYNLACAYAQLGRAEQAIDRLWATFNAPQINHRAFLEWASEDSALSPIRAHPDFRSLLAWLETQVLGSRSGDRPPGFGSGGRIAVAVLPFVNVGNDPNNALLADGMTEDVITDMTRVPALSVIARGAVGKVAGKALDIGEIARTLSVRFVLEGSVRASGDEIVVSAELVDAYNGSCIWAGRYSRSAEESLKAQHDISQGIASDVIAKLLPRDTEPPAQKPPLNPEAHRQYLVGRSYFVMRGGGSPSLRVARQAFEKAAQIDPNYAKAHAGIANTDCLRLWRGDPEVSLETILQTASRAMNLGPDLPEAHVAMGMALHVAGRLDDAAKALSETVRLGPNLFEANFFAGRNLRAMGRHAEAVAYFERAAELEPDLYRALGLAVGSYAKLGEREKLASAAKRCIDRCQSEISVHPRNVDTLAFGAAVLAMSGQGVMAQEWIDRALELQPADVVANYNLAAAYAALGEREFSLRLLRTALEHASAPAPRRYHLDWLSRDPVFDTFRGDPGFLEIIRWAESGAATAAHAGLDDRIVAVARFKHAGDPLSSEMAGTLPELIIKELSRIPTLRAERGGGGPETPEQGASVEDHVVGDCERFILDGDVAYLASGVSVVARLLDPQTRESVWTNRYEAGLEPNVRKAHDIARAIAAEVAGRLIPAPRNRTNRSKAANPEADRQYQVGRSYFMLRGGGIAGLKIARQAFEKAIQIDPECTKARSGIVSCDAQRLWRGDASVSIEGILEQSDAALKLDPDIAETHLARGMALYMAGRNAEAARALAEAVRLGPDLVEAHYFAGRNCQTLGRYADAAIHFERASDLAPDHYRAPGLAVGAYRAMGAEQESLRVMRQCIERCEAELQVHPSNIDAMTFGAAVLAEAGHTQAALGWIEQAEALGPIDAGSSYNLAAAYAAIGHAVAALRWLERVFAVSGATSRVHADWLRNDTAFDRVRDHPEIIALMRRHASGAGDETSRADGRRGASRHPAIAVLPLKDLSETGNEQYLADGIVEEITAALSRMRSFVVISRASTLRYRDRAVAATVIGRELGVRYLLHGSVRTEGERIRAAMQLLDAETGATIWAERFEGRRRELFDLQDEITERVAGAIEPTIRAAEIERARRRRPDSLEAYDCVMRALPHMLTLTEEAANEALRLALEAVRLDSGYARAHALAAWCHAWLFANDWASEREDTRSQGTRLAQSALRLDGEDPNVLTWVSAAEMILANDLDAAASHVGKALAIDPNYAWGWIRSGYVQVCLGNAEIGLEHFQKAARLSPYDPLSFNLYIGKAMAHFAAERYLESAEWANMALAERPELPAGYRLLAASMAMQGRIEPARSAASALLKECPTFCVQSALESMPFQAPGTRSRFAEALRMSGVPETSAVDRAERHSIEDKAALQTGEL